MHRSSGRRSSRLLGHSPEREITLKNEKAVPKTTLNEAELKFIYDIKECEVVLERKISACLGSSSSDTAVTRYNNEVDVRKCKVVLERIPMTDRRLGRSRSKTPDMFGPGSDEEEEDEVANDKPRGQNEEKVEENSPSFVLDSPDGSQGK